MSGNVHDEEAALASPSEKCQGSRSASGSAPSCGLHLPPRPAAPSPLRRLGYAILALHLCVTLAASGVVFATYARAQDNNAALTAALAAANDKLDDLAWLAPVYVESASPDPSLPNEVQVIPPLLGAGAAPYWFLAEGQTDSYQSPLERLNIRADSPYLELTDNPRHIRWAVNMRHEDVARAGGYDRELDRLEQEAGEKAKAKTKPNGASSSSPSLVGRSDVDFAQPNNIGTNGIAGADDVPRAMTSISSTNARTKKNMNPHAATGPWAHLAKPPRNRQTWPEYPQPPSQVPTGADEWSQESESHGVAVAIGE